MGILNITPDSFSDGGRYLCPGNAVEAAMEMERQGADIIDIGGQSTRPGAVAISPDEEMARLTPVLERLKGRLSVPVSIDTFNPEVARFALEWGVHIINDVTGFEQKEMRETVSAYGCGCIALHSLPIENDPDCGQSVRGWCLKKAAQLLAAGVKPECICFDPGIGFGKSYEQNLRLISTNAARPEGFAWMVGASRKRVIGTAGDQPDPAKRDTGTVAAHTAAVMAGANIIRAHDVAMARQGANVAQALLECKA